jgi:hypothetical protein
MKHTRALTAGLMAAAALCTPAAAHAATAATPNPVDPLPSCAGHDFSQPLLALKDKAYYTLAPGGTFATDTTDGWQLTGGASIIDGVQSDGSSGQVLDLPSGAQASSPPMCITADYPTARLAVRNVAGGDGVFFNVQYYRDGVWTAPKDNGQFHGQKNGWTLSGRMNIHPDKASGWQQVRFTFLAGGKTSRFQVDDFWVDPRMRY